MEAGAVIADGENAVAQPHLDETTRRAPLARVVEQVGDGAVDALARAAHERGLQLTSKRRSQRRRVRSTASATIWSRRTSSRGQLAAVPRASSTTSLTSAVGSSSSSMMSRRSASRSSGVRRAASWSTWMLARSEAIGVRSSWLASAIRWRWAATERSSRSSVG